MSLAHQMSTDQIVEWIACAFGPSLTEVERPELVGSDESYAARLDSRFLEQASSPFQSMRPVARPSAVSLLDLWRQEGIINVRRGLTPISLALAAYGARPIPGGRRTAGSQARPRARPASRSSVGRRWCERASTRVAAAGRSR